MAIMYKISRVPKTNHYSILNLFKSTTTTTQTLITSTLCINTIQRKPICSNNANTSTVEAASLISIFTTTPFSLQSPELQELGPKLTPHVVENVLQSLRDWRLAHAFFDWASNQQGYSHSCYTYNAMASILSRARQNAPLRALAANLFNSGISWTPGALGYFIRCLGGQGLVEEANSLFDQVKLNGLCVLNGYSYNCLLEAISKSGDAASLMECRLSEMRSLGWPIDKHALTPVLQCYCNAGMFEKALVVFNELHDKGWVDQHVLAILLLSYSRSGKVDLAFEFIEWIERNLDTALNEKTFCVLIHGFVRECRVDKALQLYDKMKKVGYFPDISVYDVLIGALCKNKEIEKALMLYERMKESGISPDVRILSQIISSNLEEKYMIQLLEDCWTNLDEEKSMLLYHSVLTALVNDGSVDKAYHLLKAATASGIKGNGQADKMIIIKDKLDSTYFQTVIDGLCKADKLDMALDLFHDMDLHGCRRSVLLYNNIINCLSYANRLDECIELLKEMKSSEFQPTHFTYNSILGCLCRREDTTRALDMLREMRACGHEPWIKYYTLLVKKLCERGRAVEARDFLASMTEGGFIPDMIAYSAAINGFFNINELDHGIALFRNICEQGYCPDVVAYNIIIKGLCRAKRINDAEVILNEMLGKGLIPSVVTYNLLIDGWCKDGNTNQALLCFTKMVEEEQEPNVITYTTLVDGLCNAGKPEDALSLWTDMEHKGCDPNRISYMALIHGLCKCKKPDVALIFLDKMEQKKMIPDIFIYQALTNAFVSDSNTAMAEKVLEKMAKHNVTS